MENERVKVLRICWKQSGSSSLIYNFCRPAFFSIIYSHIFFNFEYYTNLAINLPLH